MPQRLYLIKASGKLVNASRGVASYDLDTVAKTVDNMLSETRIPYNRIEVEYQKLGKGPRTDYSSYTRNRLIFFVASTIAAADTLLDVYRILNAHIEGAVFPVSSSEGLIAVYRTLKGAYAKRDEINVDKTRNSYVTMTTLEG
jgi:hypothetical protein